MNPDLTQLLVTDLELDPRALLPHTRLDDAGLDSLALVELGMLLTTRWGVTITDDELAATKTLGALDHLVTQRRADR
ncbi:acyl carrier protein [Embleya sp. NPDC059237]|uniref:acyl carrier protein n=1 Tax=Embleya sp. NPDC059237 TaxID=3346784 RepID=UPI00367372B6